MSNGDVGTRFLEDTGCRGFLVGAETYPTSRLDEKKKKPTAN